MATIATAEVQVIADTSRFVPDLRRKLRAALTGIGTDVGDQITQAMRGLGDQISSAIEREVRRSTPRVERTIGNLGREAATNFNDQFKNSITRTANYDEFFAQLFHRTIAEALEEEAQEATRAFEEELRLEDAAVRKAIAAADALDGAFESRFARNFAKYEDIFESEFDLEQAAFNKAIAAADAMDEAFEQRFAVNFERRGEQAAQALADGIQSQQNTVADAFSDILDGIDARQRQALLRARQNGGNLALAFSQGVQRGAAQAAEDAADALANSIEVNFRTRLRLLFARVLEFDELFDSTRPAVQRTTQVLRSLGDALTNVARQITIVPLRNLGNLFSDLTTNTASAVAMLLLFLGALDQLAGLLFAVPAAFSLLTAGVATAAVAFRGMGNAFAAAGDDAEAFEEAISDLAPSAQNVAREFRALNDDFDRLRLDVQEALWSRLEGTITEVADNLLGPLREGMVLAAGALGDLIAGIGEFLAETETAETVSAVFESLAAIFQSLADEVQPFLAGIRTLVDEFLPGLEDVEGVIDGIGTAFQEWVDTVTTGDLLSGISPAQRAFLEALQVLEQLGRITVNVATAVGSIFDAADRNGRGFIDLIEEITEKIAVAFAAPEGQDTLRGFLDDLVSIAEVVLDVLGSIFEQFPKIAEPLAGIAEDIGPDLMDFINELGDAFAVFLEEAAPGFEELASALGELDLQDIANNLGDAFRNVAPFLHEMVELFGDIAEFVSVIVRILSFIPRGIAEFARAFVFLQDFLDNVRNIDGILSGIGDGFADFGTRVADGFGDALEGTGEFFSEFGPRVADGFGDALESAGEFFTRIGEGFVNLFGPIGEAVATFFTETFPGWVRDGTDFVLELVAGWIAVLIDLFSGLWENLTTGAIEFFLGLAEDISASLDIASEIVASWVEALRFLWDNFWNGLGERALLALQGLGLDVTASLDGVSSTFTGFGDTVSERWRSFWRGVGDTARNAWNTVLDIVSSGVARVREFIANFISNTRSIWNSFWSGLSSIASSTMSGIRSAISGALDGLRNAFASFVDRVVGIWDGLIERLRSVRDTITGIISDIRSAVDRAVSAASSLSSIDLNPFANGGIVTGPTPALIGEAGPEVVIPLTRPARAVDLVQQSGLLGLLASQGVFGPGAEGTTASGPPVEMHVHSENTDPEQVARRAVRLIERRIGGRGLERTK